MAVATLVVCAIFIVGGVVAARDILRERITLCHDAQPHQDEKGREVIGVHFVCPTPCDDECDETCHEVHLVRWKRGHDPSICISRSGHNLGPTQQSCVGGNVHLVRWAKTLSHKRVDALDGEPAERDSLDTAKG